MKLWYIKYDFLKLESIQIIKEILIEILLNKKEIREKYFETDITVKKKLLKLAEKYWYNYYIDIINNIINSWKEEEKLVYDNIFKKALTQNVFQFEWS